VNGIGTSRGRMRFCPSEVTVVQALNGRWLALCVHVCGRGGCDLYETVWQEM